MANHKSAEKRIRSSETKKVSNRYKAKTTRNAVKTLRGMTTSEEINNKLPETLAMLDKLAKKNVIHKNKASNLKSKLMKQANAAARQKA